MHNSSCPKCGTAFDGDSKKCGSCGAVSSSHSIKYPLATTTYLHTTDISPISLHRYIYLSDRLHHPRSQPFILPTNSY
ncbi:hypothetical protein F5B19DRAFT_448479 [Rostrohypoxylon terebratum]|nr:hypothetical protein F5B19DRAFT_448479 [Rostrohypoxylon terebratum]